MEARRVHFMGRCLSMGVHGELARIVRSVSFVFSVRPSVDTLVRVSTLLFPLCSLHVIVSVCVSVCSCVCGASFISNVRPAGGNAVPGLSSRVRSAVIRSSGPLSRVCCVIVPIRLCPWLLNAFALSKLATIVSYFAHH